jgi:hypothetical protein
MENLTYSKVGDFNLPNLILPPKDRDLSFGKYGRMRERYLKKHRRVMYINLLTSCKLQEHLHDIDVRCNEMVAEIVSNLAKTNGVDEHLKFTDQMKWVGLMNSFKAQAEEVVQHEVIYA